MSINVCIINCDCHGRVFSLALTSTFKKQPDNSVKVHWKYTKKAVQRNLIFNFTIYSYFYIQTKPIALKTELIKYSKNQKTQPRLNFF